MKYYTEIVEIEKEDAELYQEILDDYTNHFEDEEFPRDAVLFSVEGTFENGAKAIYEVFTGDENVMSSCYFYDKDGEELGYVENDSSVLGSNEFQYKEDEIYNFTVALEGDESFTVVTSL